MVIRTKRASAGEGFVARAAKPVPHGFVLDELASVEPTTRPMFGCLAVYVGPKIVMILREKDDADSGVWLATTQAHHASLRADFPALRSITVLGPGVTGWQILPEDAADFEEAVLRACACVMAGDPRIGKIPGARTKKPAAKKKPRVR